MQKAQALTLVSYKKSHPQSPVVRRYSVSGDDTGALLTRLQLARDEYPFAEGWLTTMALDYPPDLDPVQPLLLQWTGLPAGYIVHADRDGDWWLEGPEHVTLFSVPGEILLLGRCADESEAVTAALQELRVLAAGAESVESVVEDERR